MRTNCSKPEFSENDFILLFLDGLFENQIKDSCIRQRIIKLKNDDEIKCCLENMKIISKEDLYCSKEEIEKALNEIIELSYIKVDSLNTHKIDY